LTIALISMEASSRSRGGHYDVGIGVLLVLGWLSKQHSFWSSRFGGAR
jgi:hypothetical protein